LAIETSAAEAPVTRNIRLDIFFFTVCLLDGKLRHGRLAVTVYQPFRGRNKFSILK
jgi:hypothetical protein